MHPNAPPKGTPFAPHTSPQVLISNPPAERRARLDGVQQRGQGRSRGGGLPAAARPPEHHKLHRRAAGGRDRVPPEQAAGALLRGRGPVGDSNF